MSADLTRPGFHLAIPVDDIAKAREFYGGALALPEGRSADAWVDWNFHSHQLVTHLAPGRADAGHNEVDGHRVPVPHFGLLLSIAGFRALAQRLRAAGASFLIEPYARFAGQPGEQWTMFLRDSAGNALEFKAFRDESRVFAR
jgi:extradiol dioxygenase family protein